MPMSLKALRKRIRTVASTRQITKAMKAVAVSKLRRAQSGLQSTKRYAAALSEIAGHLLQAAPDVDHAYRRQATSPKKATIAVVTADRGLCGAFNTRTITHAEKLMKRLQAEGLEVELFGLGKKGLDYFRRRDYTIAEEYRELGGTLDVDVAIEITEKLVARFVSEETDRVVIVCNSFINMMEYRTYDYEFLPLDPTELLGDEAAGDRGDSAADIIFEPSAEAVFGQTLARYLRTRLVATLADSFTAEHAARMMAMTTASDNCDELLDTLTLQRNKARQASITKELLEIVGGAEALKGG